VTEALGNLVVYQTWVPNQSKSYEGIRFVTLILTNL
jgi:hypothetical protein